MDNQNIDYIGTDSSLIGTTRINNKDYEFLQKMAIKYSWGKIATMQRMAIKFAKENHEQFEKFLDNMRRFDKPLL